MHPRQSKRKRRVLGGSASRQRHAHARATRPHRRRPHSDPPSGTDRVGTVVGVGGENGLICGAAARADSAARLATIGMSSLDEIGGRGAGEVMQMGALLSPMMGAWGEGGAAAADEDPSSRSARLSPTRGTIPTKMTTTRRKAEKSPRRRSPPPSRGPRTPSLDWRTTRGTRKMTTGGIERESERTTRARASRARGAGKDGCGERRYPIISRDRTTRRRVDDCACCNEKEKAAFASRPKTRRGV